MMSKSAVQSVQGSLIPGNFLSHVYVIRKNQKIHSHVTQHSHVLGVEAEHVHSFHLTQTAFKRLRIQELLRYY
jgi:hypothetical protein